MQSILRPPNSIAGTRDRGRAPRNRPVPLRPVICVSAQETSRTKSVMHISKTTHDFTPLVLGLLLLLVAQLLESGDSFLGILPPLEPRIDSAQLVVRFGLFRVHSDYAFQF